MSSAIAFRFLSNPIVTFAVGIVLVVLVFLVVGMIIGHRSKNYGFFPTSWNWRKWPFTDAGLTTSTNPDVTSPGTPSGEIALAHGPYGATTKKKSTSASGDFADDSSGTAPTFDGDAVDKGYCSRTLWAKYAYATQIIGEGGSETDPNGETSSYVVMPRFIKIWDAAFTTSGTPPVASQTTPPVNEIINDFIIPIQTDATIKANKDNLVINLYVKYASDQNGANLSATWRKVGYTVNTNIDTTTTAISENLITSETRGLPHFCTVAPPAV